MRKLDSKKWRKWGTVFCVAVVCGLIVFVVFLLFSGKRTEVIANAETAQMVGLVCARSGKDNKFFNEERVVIEGKHMIRANFSDDKLLDLMYTYEAAYDEGVDLGYMKNVAEANFNLEYGNKYVYGDNLWISSFNVDKAKKMVKMSVYAGAESLDSRVAEVFQLEEKDMFPKTEKAMKTAYESVGFYCNSSKNNN